MNIAITCAELLITPIGKYISILSKADAIEELIEDDINVWDAEIEELTTDNSKSVAIKDNELLSEELTVSIIDVDNEELNDANEAELVLSVDAIEELSAVKLYKLALNEVATDELKGVILPDKLIAVFSPLPNKYKVPLPLS